MATAENVQDALVRLSYAADVPDGDCEALRTAGAYLVDTVRAPGVDLAEALETIRDHADAALQIVLKHQGEAPSRPELSDATARALFAHPLHEVWAAAVDASHSDDFRRPGGELDEAAYVRCALNVMRRVYAQITAAA